MAVGDETVMAPATLQALSERQRSEVQRVVDLARSICGFGFGVYVGPLTNSRESAVAQHASMSDPAGSVLVAVDPQAQAIEVITGTRVGIALDDRSCEFAVLSMTSCCMNGDLVGGIRECVTQLAEHARAPKVWHLDEPQ